jgi:hypothetical protein
MWCSHCHQEVPGVPSAERGTVACARCQHDLKYTSASRLCDAGISLDDAAPQAKCAIDRFATEESKQKLRRLGQQLRPTYQQHTTLERPLFWERLTVDSPELSPQLRSVAHQDANLSELRTPRNNTSFFLGVLLGSGFLALMIGVAALIWSAAFNQAVVWRWGLTTTVVGEGLLILGLTWMAARLWQKSRQLDQNLHSVDSQLTEVSELAGELTASQLSSSQHYYQHFSQSANPHLLVANLRGQIDQLAERLAG